MSSKASVTILRPVEEVERLWRDPRYSHPNIDKADAQVRFLAAPGDRGTEVHVALGRTAPGGVLGEAILKAVGTDPLAKAKDELRRFKGMVETGVLARSEASPEGELLERKLRQRPAQPLTDEERQEVGV